MPLARKTTSESPAPAFVPLPRPKSVLPLQSKVTGFSHSRKAGTTFKLCISSWLAAQLYMDCADIWDFVKRQAEVERYYLPAERPQIEIGELPAHLNPEGMYGVTLQVLCTWAPKKAFVASR